LGAAGRNADYAITHIAFQEALMGEVVNWTEHVSEEQYGV